MRCWRDLTPHTRVSLLSRHAHNHPWDAVTSSRRSRQHDNYHRLLPLQQVLAVKTRPHVIHRLLVRRDLLCGQAAICKPNGVYRINHRVGRASHRVGRVSHRVGPSAW